MSYTNLQRAVLFISCFILSAAAYAAFDLNMPYGVTPMAHKIYQLHMAAIYVCCGIGAVVFSLLIFSLIKYRKSKGVKAAHFHEHLWLEIVWTTIPFLILVALAVPATIVLGQIHNTDKAELIIKVTGYQWKWKYEYLNQGISFFSNLSTPLEQINQTQAKGKYFLQEVDHPLVVPVNTKIKILVTSDDVVHDWWVPDLGVKQDAIPGFVNENWFIITQPGTYRGACGELCGVNHAFMPVVVEAVSKDEFKQWLLANQPGLAANVAAMQQPLPEAELMKLGQAQYEKSCAMCHQVTGEGLPPHFPALKGSRVAAGPVDAEIAFVLKGVPGTAMQAFDEQLNDQELAAVLTYTRHAWGNEALNKQKGYATTIQPADVAQVRKRTP